MSVRVNVRLLLLKRQADAERVSLWAGYLGQTSARRLGKRQSKCLCSAVGGLASDRKAAPRPPAPAHPRQSQYLWTLKMNAPRIRLQEHSRRCDTAYDGGFALQRANFVALQRRASPENLITKNICRSPKPSSAETVCHCECMDAWQSLGSSSTISWSVRAWPRIFAARARTSPHLRTQELVDQGTEDERGQL